MLNKVYNILPGFVQNLAIEIHRDLRLFAYEFLKAEKSAKCSGISKNVLEGFNRSRRYGPLKHVCYAPYTSMFFSRSGLVSPCYASYNSESSHMSQHSIREIWFNGSFRKIREEHSTCNLSSTCKFCKDIMESGSYGSLLINKYEHYAFSKSEYPVIMEFELSNTCNLSCIMCDSNLSSGIAGADCAGTSGNQHYKSRFFDELREFIPYLQLAEFTGGDPFMIEEYYKIWEMISVLNPACNILVTTNANTMNPRVERFMDSHKKISFNISIDSLQKENYEKIRRNGNFEFALNNIEKFLNYSRKNKTQVNILVCPMTVNRNEFADFVNFANEKQICVYFHTVIKPKNLSLKYFDKNELGKLIADMEKQKFPARTKNEKINSRNFSNLIELLKTWYDDKDSEPEAIESQKPEISTEEAEKILRDKVLTHSPHLADKFDELLSGICDFENADYVKMRLFNVKDDEFFEYLADKSISDLIEICRGLKK